MPGKTDRDNAVWRPAHRLLLECQVVLAGRGILVRHLLQVNLEVLGFQEPQCRVHLRVKSLEMY